MMKTKNYAIAFKTGDAELRALMNLGIDMKNTFPIVEITRGRKSKNDSAGLIKKRIDKVKSIFKGRDICLDLTTSKSLSNDEIDMLYSFDNGYQKWIELLLSLKDEKVFNSISPTILVNIDDPDFENNLKLQVKRITDSFDSIAYRNSLADDACYDDIKLIADIITRSGKKFYFIVDCEYIAPGAWKSFADKAKIRIEKIKSIIDETQFIVISTSFPNNVSDIGNEDKDTFRLNEIDLYFDICNRLKTIGILYGDYASINPIRNDGIIMSRGWRPRIDVALQNEIYYFREKRGKNEYSATYTLVAKNVRRDHRFPDYLNSNWGVQQIISSSLGNAPGSNPSFGFL